MDNALVVSTECPTCGGPLDFSEGSNAIQCPFCRSNLLVTGRKQSLSYYISPRLVIHGAVARVMIAHKENGRPCRVVNPELYFIPYYRLTGHDLRWEETERKKDPFGPEPETIYPALSGWSPFYRPEGALLFSAIQLAGNLLEKAFSNDTSDPSPVQAPIDQGVRKLTAFPPLAPSTQNPASGDCSERVQFIDRYVEKNFIACGIRGSGIYSLGVRPSVLRLRLFDRAVLQTQGKIVSPTVPPADGPGRQLRTPDQG